MEDRLDDSIPFPTEADRPVEPERAAVIPGVMYVTAADLEQWGKDFLQIAEANARARRNGKNEPEVWTASDELSAVKYAREMGYISDLEAQKKVRKLLRLPGKRTRAAQRVRRARR